jgi:tetratricopeptide (TPR) repeat protein
MDDEQIIARLRSSSDAVTACDFLLSWMGVRADVAGREKPRDFERMMHVIQTADPDPWRVRIRGAIPNRVSELVELLDDPQLWSWELRTISYLASMLARTQFGDHRDAALCLLRELTERQFDDFMLQFEFAELLTQGSAPLWEEALAHATAAVALSPGTSGAWTVLGKARNGLGDFEGAIAALDRTLELDPGAVWARYLKAEVELNLGRSRSAIETLELGLVSRPGSDDLRYALALAQLQAGDVPAARATLLDLLQRPEESASVTRAAELLVTAGQAAAAEGAIRSTLQGMSLKTPVNQVVRLRDALVHAIESQGRFEQAIAELRVTEQLFPNPDRARRADRDRALASLAEELDDFVSGAREPDSPEEAAQVANLLQRRGTTGFAAQLWADSLAADEAAVLAAEPLARVRAAAAALAAAAGEGDDAAELDEPARSRERATALAMLRREVDAALEGAASFPGARTRPSIERLFLDPALLPVRDPARRAALPDQEARAWEQFFADARAALQRVRG